MVDDAERVPGTIAAQLGFGTFEALVESPAEQPVLLMVDNCEHVLAAAADSVATLLATCKAPTILATSRSPLGLPGESLVVLGPLPVPLREEVGTQPDGGPDSDPEDAEPASMRLLRARAADAGIPLAQEHRPALARLCRELEGVPLALEVAAARLRTMSAEEMMERLRGGVEVLSRSGYRGARRHRGVSETLSWSYDLLPHEVAVGFERLGVLAGPFPADMAAAVAGRRAGDVAGHPGSATDDLLRALVDASLLNVEHRGRVTWYRMLVTVRAFARRRLEERGDIATALDALADHVLGRLSQLASRGQSGWRTAQLSDLLALYEHAATALRWCLEHDDGPDRAVLLCAYLGGVVHHAHAEDIAALAEEMPARWPDVSTPGMADVAGVLATARHVLAAPERARAVAERALPGATAGLFASVTLPRVLAHCAHARGDADVALAHFEEAVSAAQARGLVEMAMECRTWHASVLSDLGRGSEALAELTRIQHEARTAGADLNELLALTTEGYVRLRVDPERAGAVVTEALRRSRLAEYSAGVVAALRATAMVGLVEGNTAAAARTLLTMVEEPPVLAAVGADIRMLLDVAAVVLLRLGRPGWKDIACTCRAAAGLSVLLSVGQQILAVPDAPDGRVLSRGSAVALVRRQLTAGLAALEASSPSASHRPTLPARAQREADGSADSVAAEAAAAPEAPDAVFADRGGVWEIRYAGRSVHVRPTKGVTDLARLIRQPHREVHCLELMGATLEEGSTGEVLDAEGRRALEQRLRDLQSEIDDAEADHDSGRADWAQAEFDAVLDHLSTALGLAGRRRRTAGTAERARSAVTQRIRSTMRRLGAMHPDLGRHLDASVTTGTFCAYRPERPITWGR